MVLYFRNTDNERPKTSKGKQQSADDVYRQKLELQNEQEENLEKFQESLKKEETEEKAKMQAKHELNIKSNLFLSVNSSLYNAFYFLGISFCSLHIPQFEHIFII